MTERLYYTAPYLTEFEADVLSVEQIDGRTAVILDRTAFYPTSGGQPFDTGTLGGARVVEVLDRDDGTIVHVVEGGAPQGRVAGEVDWARRFDHMQQHTGQHVLSAAFDRLLGVRTVSFHLGSAAATIDLAREVSATEIAQAENAANEAVWNDRPVSVRFVDAAEAAALPLRKESIRTGTLRIVEVEDFDVSACGGTHVARTGAIGIIAISAWERFKGGSRVEFRCGLRALGAYRTLRDTVAAGIRLISVAPEELPAGIERVQEENRELKRRARDLEGRLARFEAEVLVARAVPTPAARMVIEAVPEVDINGLKTLAQHVVARPGHVAALFTAASPVSVVLARSSDVTVDAAALLKQLIAQFGGKGGGRAEMAQGGGMTGEAGAIVARAQEMLAGPSA